MKRRLFLLLVAAAILVGWYVASPWLAMRGLRDAAQELDRAELEERVDFAAIRENMKGEIRSAVDGRLGEDSSVIEQFGGVLATGLGGMAVDAAVTPSGVAAVVLTGRFATSFVPGDMQGDAIEWDVDRDGINAFEARGQLENGRAGPTLHFRRDGLGWKLDDIDLPEGGIEIGTRD